MDVKTPRTVSLFTELKPGSRVLWFLLAVLAIAPLFPLSNFVGHPHWDHIRWIPFQDFFLSRNMLKDVSGNILWFMMFGYLLHYQLRENSYARLDTVTITAVAGSVSLSTEFFQVFCHNRTSSMTDVVCNVLGAGLGGYFAEKQYALTATESWPTSWLSKMIGPKRSKGFSRLYRHGPPAGVE